MPQGTKSTAVMQPSLGDIRHLTFSGDLSDVDSVTVSISVKTKDDVGNDFRSIGVSILASEIPALNGLLNSINNAVVPKMVEKVEDDLGITFV